MKKTKKISLDMTEYGYKEWRIEAAIYKENHESNRELCNFVAIKSVLPEIDVNCELDLFDSYLDTIPGVKEAQKEAELEKALKAWAIGCFEEALLCYELDVSRAAKCPIKRTDCCIAYDVTEIVTGAESETWLVKVSQGKVGKIETYDFHLSREGYDAELEILSIYKDELCDFFKNTEEVYALREVLCTYWVKTNAYVSDIGELDDLISQ